MVKKDEEEEEKAEEEEEEWVDESPQCSASGSAPACSHTIDKGMRKALAAGLPGILHRLHMRAWRIRDARSKDRHDTKAVGSFFFSATVCMHCMYYNCMHDSVSGEPNLRSTIGRGSVQLIFRLFSFSFFSNSFVIF